MVLQGGHGDGERAARRMPGLETLPVTDKPAPRATDDYYPPESSALPPGPRLLRLLSHVSLNEALDRLRFAIDRDGIALLSAESDCGKSTVLGCLSRDLDPTAYLVVYSSSAPDLSRAVV
jgi:hypothetical protein